MNSVDTVNAVDTVTAAQAPASVRRHAVFHPLTVAEVDRLSDDAVAITFAVPAELAAEYRFAPGQHLTVRTQLDGVEVRRNYSLCAPSTSGPLRIAVKRLGGGAFSEWATTRLAPGQVLDVMTPTGRFSPPLAADNAKHYVAVAAGSGVTPVLSILATVLEVEAASRCTLVYGNRSTASVMFLEELADLKDRYPTRFQLVHVLSRETQESDLLTGRIDADKLQTMLRVLVPVDTVDEWFLCGPYAMVEDLRATLSAAGADPLHVHVELFHVEGEAPRAAAAVGDAPAGAGSAVTIWLDGRASTFELAWEGPVVLDAALQVRADAPYACKGGVCGTCRAKLVEGTVRMERNYALEPEELQRGFVLACQSHPTSERVVLDFDA